LGEVLSQQGLVNEAALDEALTEQKELRDRRVGVHELMTNSAEIKRAIKHNLGVEEITRLAMQQGMRNIRMDGIQKIFQSMTDLLQVNKVSA
jgi:type II secretory ATPase GspE/PulE/Tfp pilus assembly ATPase PilB-like protein